MAGKKTLKRYGIEGIAKALIALGALLVLVSWSAALYYSGITNFGTMLFIIPLIFTCVLAIMLLLIRYRYEIFERYPYLMNLPSMFYHIGDKKDGKAKQSLAFSMIFTVHALVIAFMGLLSLVLTISVGTGIKGSHASPFLYAYLAIVAILIISVLLQYRRIYIKFGR